MKNTLGEPRTFHCTMCHMEHMAGTSYICSPQSGTFCTKCNGLNFENEKRYNYCPHCGKKL